MAPTLHFYLDWEYPPDGEAVLRAMIAQGADVNQRAGALAETPLHVATRRRREYAVKALLENGAQVDAVTAGGKTAYHHAVRRNFTETAAVLAAHGANTQLEPVDAFAMAVVENRIDDARAILGAHPGVARTGNPEEDRLLADVAGRMQTEPVALLIEAGADLTATGLDTGTPLHQSAWFGSPDNARQLIDAGAPLDIFEPTHEASPIGWATHGACYSGDAENRQDAYVAIVTMLLDAGCALHYPGDSGDAYRRRLLADSPPAVAAVLRTRFGGA
jgi:ankyrin repeat protein